MFVMAEHRQHTRLWLPVLSPGLPGTENFADQDKARERRIGLITMRTGWLHACTPACPEVP
jgi:hypothetical protein